MHWLHVAGKLSQDEWIKYVDQAVQHAPGPGQCFPTGMQQAEKKPWLNAQKDKHLLWPIGFNVNADSFKVRHVAACRLSTCAS